MIYKRCDCVVQTKCRHPFWYVFVLSGTRYRRSTRTANKQTASRVEERRRIAVLEGRDKADEVKITLKKHIADYVAHTAKKNRTSYKDRAVLDRLLTVVGDRSVKDISPFHIEKWKTNRTGSVSRSTVNREINIVRGCFSRGVEWGRLATSPVESVHSYKVDDARIRVLNDDELRTVLHADPFVALVCRVTLECLPRLSEVLGLRREHIGGTWIEIRRKGGSVERVACSKPLRKAILARCHQSGFIFGGRQGVPPYEQLASMRIVRELKRLGLVGVSHHTMRHTGVTLMLEAGVNPRVIQRLAGWSSLRMLERYGHARDAEIVRAVTNNADHLSLLENTDVVAERKRQS